MKVFSSLTSLLLLIIAEVNGFWQENITPKKFVFLKDNEIFQFKRNQSYADRFCHIFQDRESLLIGARNAIFNLSLSNLEERSHLFWSAEKEDSSTCYVKGINEKKCHNYIRIIEHLGLNKLFVCGTNAYKPKCRIFDTDNFTIEDEFSGVAVNPFDPDQNSTVIYIDGFLYAGTTADFSGINAVIYKTRLFSDSYYSHHGIKDANEIKKLTLKTEPSDSINLNSPNFVSSMAQGDFIYFFLREIAVENINCGKTMFSRVARVCRNDQGGMHRFQNYWTSFLKARLNCSVPGDFPFYFDEIVSTSDFINGVYSGEALQMVYGVFTTPSNSISGSAICAYSLKSISDAFDGNFKEQSTMNSNWLAVPTNNVPDPRPGLCHNDSRTLPDLTLNFIRTHTLMDSSVLPFYGQPILTNIGYRFTKIVVDQQVKVPGNKTFDILFIGTDNGKVLKVVNGLAASSMDKVLPIIVEEIQVFPDNSPVGNLHLVKNSIYSESRLIVTNDTHILSIKLHRCNRTKISSCSECVALQDPYCAWDKLKGECIQSNQWDDSNRYYQDITTGKHFACPKSRSMLKENVNPLREYEHNLPKNHRDESMFSSRIHTNDPNSPQQKDFVIREEPTIASTDGLPKKFSLETLLSSVILGATVSSVIGFVVGYFYGRKCQKDSTDNLPYPDTDYEYFEQRQNMNCFANDTKIIPQEEVTYAEPILVPQPLRSPKNSIRKLTQPLNKHAEALYQFQNENNYSTAARDSFRVRDNYNTLRLQQNESFRRQNNLMGNVSAIAPDGYSTTRSIKKVYL